MPINISKALIKKLPETEQADIEDFLWKKSGNLCFLCEERLNRASDDIVADHDLPEAEGGPTDRKNLNFVHLSCNSFKKNSPSVPAKPFLRFNAFVKKNAHRVTYGDSVSHFSIKPKPCVCTISGNVAKFELPDGTVVETPVITESNARRSFQYVYLELPREALFNDSKCQPRTIKMDHLWKIYSDLQRNPLHEAPGCRLENSEKKQMVELLMFDGQHKTIACWLMGRQTIVAKVYLDLPAHDAIELVNSVQAKIRKLTLSPFELASKLADEWQHQLSQYEKEVGGDEVSEKGFINWLPQPERARGKQAFRAALVKVLIKDDDLEFKKFIRSPATGDENLTVTENTFKAKLIEKLMMLDPLSEKGDDGQLLRSREKNNIVKLLNIFTELAFEPDEGTASLSKQQVERMRRMLYQNSLAEIAKLLRAIVGYELVVKQPRELMEKDPTSEQWAKIKADTTRLIDHLVWSTDVGSSEKMKRVKDAWQKNQDLEQSFSGVGLKLGYIVGADKLEASCVAD